MASAGMYGSIMGGDTNNVQNKVVRGSILMGKNSLFKAAVNMYGSGIIGEDCCIGSPNSTYTTTQDTSHSFATGYALNIGSGNQFVSGKYNIYDNQNTYAQIVGNGTADNARSNAYTLDWSGNGTFAGNVFANGSKKLATEEYVDSHSGGGSSIPEVVIEVSQVVSEDPLEIQLTQEQATVLASAFQVIVNAEEIGAGSQLWIKDTSGVGFILMDDGAQQLFQIDPDTLIASVSIRNLIELNPDTGLLDPYDIPIDNESITVNDEDGTLYVKAIPPHPEEPGTYVLQCEVEAGGGISYQWVNA